MKTPEYQFTGWFIPTQVIDLFHMGEIDTTGVLLFAMLHSLAKKRDGCWATNTYLAEMLGIKKRALQYQLKNMEARKLIRIQIHAENKRNIWTFMNAGFRRKHEEESSEGGAMGCTGGCNGLHPSPLLKEGRDSVTNTVELPLNGGFFGVVPQTGFSMKAAKKLHQALLKHRKIMRKADLHQWAKEFKRLRTEDGVSKETIKATLIWYMKNIGGKYVPEAYSAKSFREKFDSIHHRMNKASITSATVAAPLLPSELDEDEMAVYEDLKMNVWPKGSGAQLPAVIRASLINFRKVNKRKWKLIKEDEEKWSPIFLPLENVIGQPNNSIRQYLQGVWRNVRAWSDWNGDLTKYVWSLDNRYVVNAGMDAASKHGNPKIWAQAIKGLNES